MNIFVLQLHSEILLESVATLITPLLDTGAEFSKFMATKNSPYFKFGSACILIALANPLDFIDGTPNQPNTSLSPALIRSRSPRRQ